MKIVNNALIIALIGAPSISAKLNSANRDLQIFGNNETALLGGLADTVGGVVDNFVNSTSEAISGFIENATVPDVSGLLNGTLDGFMPEGGFGLEIPGDNETVGSTVAPETLPAETGSTVGVETLPTETGSTVGVETLPAETGSTVTPASTVAATTTDEDVEDEEEVELENVEDALEGEGSAASGKLISILASIVSVGMIIHAL